MKYPGTILVALFPLFLLTPATAHCQNGAVLEFPMKIAGGKTVPVKITDQGPVSAENDKIAITATAVFIAPSIVSNNIPALIWSFGLKAKTADEIKKITVENVFPSDPAVLLHTDNQPRLNNRNWIGQIENGDPDGPNNLWLKAEKIAAFVFKFTVYFKDGTDTTLYQLSVFSEADKSFFLKHAEHLRVRNAD
jgi:hypothetical protein